MLHRNLAGLYIMAV